MSFMMIVYLFSVAATLKHLAGVSTFVLFIISGVLILVLLNIGDFSDEFRETWESKFARIVKGTIAGFFFSIFVLVLMPSEKIATYMLAAYGVDRVSQVLEIEGVSENLSEVTLNSIQLLNAQLKEQIDQLASEDE